MASMMGEGGRNTPSHVITLVFEVSCKVERRHPPAAEFALDRVGVGDCGLQTSEQMGQGTLGRETFPSYGSETSAARGLPFEFSEHRGTHSQ